MFSYGITIRNGRNVSLSFYCMSMLCVRRVGIEIESRSSPNDMLLFNQSGWTEVIDCVCQTQKPDGGGLASWRRTCLVSILELGCPLAYRDDMTK